MSLRQELIDATLKCPLTDNEYIPLGVIHEKITAKRVQEKLPTPPWYTRLFYPCQDYDLENKLRPARKVVTVLVLISKCRAIEPLLADKLTDADLPLRKDGANVWSHCGKKTFSSFQTCEDHEDLAEMFLEKQWAVLSPVLELEPGKVIDIPLEPQCALPFSCEEEAASRFSVVYKAELHPSHCRTREKRGPGRVAIKKLTSKESQDFRHEKRNLDHVRSIINDHLIRHLAICERAQCIVFPWADGGSLWDFWQFNDQEKLKRTADVYRWFLEQLTGLVHAMSELYSENFRHGDLKPTNILHFTANGVKLGTLKIADLGVSRMHAKGALTHLRVGSTITTASTLTYQAPEACDIYRTNGPRSRKYDSWSMGCIILEFIVWLLYDFTALRSFRGARDGVRENAYYRIKAGSNTQDGTKRGIEVHPEVREAVRHLKADGRCQGTALGALVRLVESDILKIVPEDRLQSVELHGKLKNMLKDAEEDTLYLFNAADPPFPVPETFSRPPPSLSAPQSTHGHP